MGGLLGWVGEGLFGSESARDDADRRYREGIENNNTLFGQAVGQSIQDFENGRNALTSGGRDARNALSNWGAESRGAINAGYDAAGNALAGGRSDFMGAFGQGQGALQGGLQGGLGAIAGGNAAAQGYLNPQIQQDMAARGAYADRLMGGLGGGDDPYWNRLSGQRTDSIEASLAKQGMLGSTAGGQALADSGAQLQNMREQQFFDRAQGLFNANAASQAAGLQQQAGLAGAGLWGETGRASAGLFGDQGRGAADLGRFGAELGARRGESLGGAARWMGEGLSGSFANQGRETAGLFGDQGRTNAGLAGGRIAANTSLWGPRAQNEGRTLLDAFNFNVGVGG